MTDEVIDLLSEAEIRRITGRERPATQERFFVEKLGIRAHRNGLNEVIVSREAYVRWQLGERPAAAKPRPRLRSARGRT